MSQLISHFESGSAYFLLTVH